MGVGSRRVSCLVGLVLVSWLLLVQATKAEARPVSPSAVPKGAWSGLAHPAPFNPGAILLLTDGRVLVQDKGPANDGSSSWWILTPDRRGSYAMGTWSRAASLPAAYAPFAFASAVLPDGRVIVEGGEDNAGKRLADTNLGAIYDPVANRWTPVAPPGNGSGPWAHIGDAPSAVLPDGRFMLGAGIAYGPSGAPQANTAEALFDASKLSWSATGAGKTGDNGEEGWTLLPNGRLLTVDVGGAPNTEMFNPATAAWQSAGSTPVGLVDHRGELGPAVLMPDGRVLATGGTGQTAIYDTRTRTWSAGVTFPVIAGQQYDIADGPGALLPDGEVLLVASPGDFKPPAHFFIFNGTNLTQIADAPGSSAEASYYGSMLALPTAQILFADGLGHLDIYTPIGAPKKAWLPTVKSVPRKLKPGATYRLTGRQLHGLSQGSAYGDESQNATNYPLVRIVSKRSRRVFYARTTHMTSMSVAPRALSSASFTLPRQVTRGAATLSVVVNGIASAPVQVTIR